jgi:hypothetical protein
MYPKAFLFCRNLIPFCLLIILFTGLSPYSELGLRNARYTGWFFNLTGIQRTWSFFAPDPYWLSFEIIDFDTKVVILARNTLRMKFLAAEREKTFRAYIFQLWVSPESSSAIENWLCRSLIMAPSETRKVGYKLTDLEFLLEKKKKGRINPFYFDKVVENQEKFKVIRCQR